MDLFFLDRLRVKNKELITEAVLREAPVHQYHTMKSNEFYAPIIQNNRDRFNRKYKSLKPGFVLPYNIRE